MSNTERVLKITNAEITKDSEECKILSGLLLTYATNNFIKAYKDSKYIDSLKESVKYIKVIDDDTESSIQPTMNFISDKDIKEYFIQNIAQKYRTYMIKESIKECKVKRVLYLGDEPIGFIIGSTEDDIFTIKYLIISPDFHDKQLAYQFMTVFLSDLSRSYGIKEVRIDINTDFTDIKRVKLFLDKLYFEEDGENTNLFVLHLNP